MNLAGYDAAALGNHEFDYGYDNLVKLSKAAKFPILSANTLYNGKTAFGDNKIFTAPDGTTVIPVSRVSYGFAGGGSDLPSKAQPEKGLFAGGSGAGITIQPIAFLAISNGNVRILQIEPYVSSVDRVVASVPDVVDKIAGLFNKDKKDKEDEDISLPPQY